MRWYLFLSRIAFVSNLFFIVLTGCRLMGFNIGHSITELLLMMSVASYFINALANLITIALFFFQRKNLGGVPVWLPLCNFIILLLQLYFLIHIGLLS